MFLDDIKDIYTIILNAALCIPVLIVFLRLSGKRTLTKLNAFDFLITLAIGSILASTITSESLKLLEGLTALFCIIFIQYLITFLDVRWPWFRKIIKSDPTILYHEGEFCDEAMLRERISKIEVLTAMRYSGLSDPKQADQVILETDGQLSVIPTAKASENNGTLEMADNFKALKNN